MVQVIESDNTWGNIGKNFGSGLTQGYTTRSDENAIRKAIEELGPDAKAQDIVKALTGTKTYGQEAKQNAIKNLIGAEQVEVLKEKNRVAGLKYKSQQDSEALKQTYISRGFTEPEAKLMADPSTTAGVKQIIERNNNAEVERGIRTPQVNAQNQPIEQQRAEAVQPQPEGAIQPPMSKEEDVELEQAAAPENNMAQQAKTQVEQAAAEEPEWPELPPPAQTTYAEKENWRKQNQTFNNKELKELHDKVAAHKSSFIRYGRLNDLNDSKKIPSGVGRLLIDPSSGEPYPIAQVAGLVNKETQDFSKTVNDFLINAKDYFGARVTNFDITSFKARLPTLLNTEEGRRLIIKQMELMEQLEMVHDQTLENGLKHYGRNANYSDILKIADDKTVAKEEQIIFQMNNIDKASDLLDRKANNPKLADKILMQDPKTGNFGFTTKNKVADLKKQGFIQW